MSRQQQNCFNKNEISGFYPSTFVYSHFSPKSEFLYFFLSSEAPCGGLMVDTKGEISGSLSTQISGKCIFLGFFMEFYSFMGSFQEKLTRKIHTTFLYECL